jgi:hypothetical protein
VEIDEPQPATKRLAATLAAATLANRRTRIQSTDRPEQPTPQAGLDGSSRLNSWPSPPRPDAVRHRISQPVGPDAQQTVRAERRRGVSRTNAHRTPEWGGAACRPSIQAAVLKSPRWVADPRRMVARTGTVEPAPNRPSFRRFRAYAAIGLSCMTASSCGASTTATTTLGGHASLQPSPRTVLSAAQHAYINKADTMCLSFFSRTAPLAAAVTAAAGSPVATTDPAEPLIHPRNRRALARATSALAQASAGLLAQLRAFAPPRRDGVALTEIFTHLSREITADDGMAAAISASDSTNVETDLRQLAYAKTAFESSAQAFSFRDCGASNIPQHDQ